MASEERVIKVGEKSPGVWEVQDVDRSAPLYRQHKPDEAAVAAAASEASTELPPVVEVLYSIPKRMKHMVSSDEELMSKSEARALLLLRVKEGSLLIQEKPGWVRLDEELQTMLKVREILLFVVRRD